jgi:hypothetical protein
MQARTQTSLAVPGACWSILQRHLALSRAVGLGRIGLRQQAVPRR